MSNVCSCPRYSGPSLFGAYMQSVRDRRPDAVVWCACIGWRDPAHSITIADHRHDHGYPYRAECACGWISKSYAAVHAARTMADDHIAEMARHARRGLVVIFKGDGRGNVVGYPLGTMVNCNQIGHNYGAHKITEYCLATAPAPWCEVCNGYICRRYLHQRRR